MKSITNVICDVFDRETLLWCWARPVSDR